MLDIIIAFPKIQDANNLKRALMRNSYEVSAVCDTGTQIIDMANRLDGGIIICGYKFPDMLYREINNYLPKGFTMLLVASPARLAECDENDIVRLEMPIRVNDLLNTLETMLIDYEHWVKKHKKKKSLRTKEDKQTIAKAKQLLMERNGMTEDEAHHYIQKISMDSAVNMVETAEMIIDINGKDWDG